MDGAGNDAIKLVYKRACQAFDVQNTFVMYSFIHRRMDKNFKFGADLTDNDRLNIDYFFQQRIPNVYETALPDWCWNTIEKAFLQHLKFFYYKEKDRENQTERNRDGFHLNKDINKLYADYFYNQWELKNES